MIGAIGAFDGFHSGHRLLLEEAEKLACLHRKNWCVVTFSPHPDVFFGRNVKLLFSEYEKRAEAKLLKIPEVIKLPFERIYNMKAVDFLEMLIKEYSISGVVVGKDFRFGYGGSGDVVLIRDFCLDNALLCSVVETVKYSDGVEKGNKISACVLREWFMDGKVDTLRDALKFPCPISGMVAHGKGRGTKLGFPTANILVSTEKTLPAEGVYAVSVLTELGWKTGALFAGAPPMFEDVGEMRIEVHISDFSGDLYDKRLTVFLEEFMRPPMVFKDESELVHDMKLCVERAVLVFNTNHSLNGLLYQELLNAFKE